MIMGCSGNPANLTQDLQLIDFLERSLSPLKTTRIHNL